jgi:hypothetical protein
MSKIYIELYDNGAEITAVREGEKNRSELIFDPVCDGFVSIGGIAARVVGGHCSFDTRLIDDGEVTPMLIEKDKRRILPRMKKNSSSLLPAEPEYARQISLRERKLEEKVKALEIQVQELVAKVYGTKLF